MFYIRTTKTASGSIAVQIVRYEKRKKIIVKHIGSARNLKELSLLKENASYWIKKHTNQPSLFSFKSKKNLPSFVPLSKCEVSGIKYTFVYEVISKIFNLFKFNFNNQKLFLDLVLIRIIEPTSKLESFVLLDELFGITHQRRNFYRLLSSFVSLKETIEEKILFFAKKNLDFDFTLVFYDVTTLYFETSKDDDFRNYGFSKDNKPNQPQIVIGLVVNKEGFPISYQIFEGKTFEGHTVIPVILNLKERYQINDLTVVADSAMLSFSNIKKLNEKGIKYIVGARVGSLPFKIIKEINQKLNQTNGAIIRFKTKNGDLICDFSLKRFLKDKHEMEKQIQKANNLLTKKGAKITKVKFLQNKEKEKYVLNTKLIEKTKLLLGIKGYYTNLTTIDNQEIINQYHNLWHVENAFRIAKSDLKMRPVYQFKKQTIQAHILICFMALAVSKFMEIKTGKPIKKIIKLLKNVVDVKILNTLTNEEITLRSKITDEIKQLLHHLSLWY